MPLKINTLPNKSIHPGRMGFASSQGSAGGSGGRQGKGYPPPSGTLRDGMGWGDLTPFGAATRSGMEHITSQPLRLRLQPGMKQVILKAGSGVAETDGAQQMLLHPSEESKESRSLEVGRPPSALGLARMFLRNARSRCWTIGSPRSRMGRSK